MNTAAEILAIDDEPVVTEAIRKIGSLESFNVDIAGNVATAIAKLSATSYPIILCDIMMPDGNGFDILNTLNSRNVDSAFILMTGFSTMENAVQAFSQGAMDFVPKPFTADELLNSLFRARNFLKLRELQRQNALLKQPSTIPFVPCPARYHRLGHSSWVSPDREGVVLVGACDLFLKTIESVREIEFHGEKEELVQGLSGILFTSNDGKTHKMPVPISGRIAKINSQLQKSPGLIEKDPYFEGWLYGIIPAHLDYEMKFLIPCCSDRM